MSFHCTPTSIKVTGERGGVEECPHILHIAAPSLRKGARSKTSNENQETAVENAYAICLNQHRNKRRLPKVLCQSMAHGGFTTRTHGLAMSRGPRTSLHE